MVSAVDLASSSPDWAPVIHPDGIQSIERDVTEIDDGRLQQLYDHWNQGRGTSPWLLNADLRSEQCPPVLSCLSMIERLADRTPSLYIRLTGEEVTNRNLGFAKGCFVEHLTPDWYRNHLVTTCQGAFQDGVPHFQLVRVVHRYHMVFYKRLILPISQFGQSVDLLLVAALRTRMITEFIPVESQLNS